MLQMDTAVGEVLEKVGFAYCGERARDRIGAGNLVAGHGCLGSSRRMLLYVLTAVGLLRDIACGRSP